jgi:hypothetical protein
LVEFDPFGTLSPLVMYRLPLESKAIPAPSWQQLKTDCM